MSLIHGTRPKAGDAPALHALIVGVGAYPFLGGGTQEVADSWEMSQLTSTATSARLVVEWLRDRAQLPVPLGTIRLLLSPADGQSGVPGASRATLPNFLKAARQWRADASSHRDNRTFFYFAGHGVQRTKDDAVLCLEELLDPNAASLHHAVDLASLNLGMSPAPGREEIARTQFYFIDACRERNVRQANFEPLTTSAVFDKDLAGRDDRKAPIFYASTSNASAAGIPNEQTLFSRALLDCVSGLAIDSIAPGGKAWGVTTTGLDAALQARIDALNREFGGDQTYIKGGLGGDATLCLSDQAPLVDVELSIAPDDARQIGALAMTGNNDVVVFSRVAPIDPYPVVEQVRAGVYRIAVQFEPGAKYSSIAVLDVAAPPRMVRTMEVV